MKLNTSMAEEFYATISTVDTKSIYNVYWCDNYTGYLLS